ncbi:ArsA family ATPase [Nocardioides mangrovicus]|uniref:arsenite-transporting ATPase n=1 Tax=Nocardioides mangrovicus TaxID=2478913 RepID=A0A3L8P131_9ACTN|nr:ArsA family ATPase [Nocardioides mangrovicus]RLV49156.1 ArsA family ATPase [Nocardioides mangrovicus]
MTRLLLLTGKGGVGKTTLAAGTAVLAARRGLRTLVMSTDAAHSLGDAFGLGATGAEPVEVEPRLWVQQVDAQRRFEASWAQIQGYLVSVLGAGGVDPVTAEELTVLPGAEEVLALLELRTRVLEGGYDVVVVDCAPTAETLRLLALPEALGWYMARVLPVERRVVRALKPVLTRAAGVPMPGEPVFDAVERLHADLHQAHQLLTGPNATVRLVLTPEAMVVAEARRSWTTLSLYGYRVDGVVANRVFPAADDAWTAGWVRSQEQQLAGVAESFAPLPLWRGEYLPAEPIGTDGLAALAERAYAGSDPVAVPDGEGPLRLEPGPEGPVLRLALPLAGREDVDLARHGDELVVTVGSYRRVLALPASLARAEVRGAAVADGWLRVRFAAPVQAAL